MDKIKIGHGAGGRLTDQLIEKIIKNLETSNNAKVNLKEKDDGASFKSFSKETIVSTDSHIIKPLFFPGGDIGKLSITGTVNDVCMMGAKPTAITLSLVIEEGFSKKRLEKIIESVSEELKRNNLPLISGDTKVMPQGEIDGLIINTTGFGEPQEKIVKDSGLSKGDKIIINGPIGDHGVALISAREEYGIKTDVKSDVKSLKNIVQELPLEKITALKDPTRGGLSEALNTMASKSGLGIELYEENIPVREEVRETCELLGINPYNLANEGKMIIGVEPGGKDEVLSVLRDAGEKPKVIGEVVEGDKVVLKKDFGGSKILRRPEGESLPRIC